MSQQVNGLEREMNVLASRCGTTSNVSKVFVNPSHHTILVECTGAMSPILSPITPRVMVMNLVMVMVTVMIIRTTSLHNR